MSDQEPQHLSATVAELVRHVEALLDSSDRVVLGLAGPPGVGKSTVAARLVEELAPGTAVVLPMDGFHLSGSELARLGLAARKGAPETFDAWGYAATLARITARNEPVVHVPRFDRDLEEPIAAGIAVDASVPLVLTEGNYLLVDDEPWARARASMSQVWYLEVPEELRHRRLLRRHQAHGRSAAQARDWVATVDEPNARLIAATAHRADLVVRLREDEPRPDVVADLRRLAEQQEALRQEVGPW